MKKTWEKSVQREVGVLISLSLKELDGTDISDSIYLGYLGSVMFDDQYIRKIILVTNNASISLRLELLYRTLNHKNSISSLHHSIFH